MNKNASTPLPKTSAPATRALNGIGIHTLEQLMDYTEAEIMALHGMGPKVMGILKDAMKRSGIVFKKK